MKTTCLQIACPVLLVLCGCASRSLLPPGPVNPAEACPEWRWIGLEANAGADCPLPASGNWYIRPVFPKAQRDLRPGTQDPGKWIEDPAAERETLRRFCVYQAVPKGPSEAIEGWPIEQLLEENSFGGPAPLAKAEADCAALGALGEPGLAELTWKELQNHFNAQSGRNGWLPAKPRAKVRLAVLDTQPKGLWQSKTQGRSPHGWAVAHLARHLSCYDRSHIGDSICAADVHTRLALPLRYFNRRNPIQTEEDETEGGYFGTVWNVADAVWQEVRAWRGDQVRGEMPLVINLSLGWDGELFGGLQQEVEAMPAPVQSLYRALEDAACRGVLTLAAAGNRIAGPEQQTGPLLPAAWELRGVASETCAEILGETVEGGPGAFADDSGSARPLLYAIGAVDTDGKPLSNARPGGMPRLAAYGDHVVVESYTPGQPTKTYTGSSVAAAVASATAAVVWSYYPELSAGEVMEALYGSGRQLFASADFYFGGGGGIRGAGARLASLGLGGGGARELCSQPPCVHKVSLCRALHGACERWSGSSCRDLESCPPPSSSALPVPPGVVGFDPAILLVVSGLTPSDAPDPCRAEKILLRSGDERVLRTPCPADQQYSATARPWTGPQPEDPPCPNCTLEPRDPDGSSSLTARGVATGDYLLHIEIDGDWPQDLPLREPTLRLGTTLLPLSLASGRSTLTTGDRATVEGIDADLVLAAERIVLEFSTSEGSIENPVLVLK